MFLNHDYISKNNLNSSVIENTITQFLLTQEGVAKVATSTNLKATEFTGRILANVQRGFHQVRSGDVLYVLESGWIPAGYNTGTTHGSPYNYDTHVPLIFFGKGIKKGISHQYHPIIDIAPTISALLDIEFPNGSTGKVIEKVLK